MIFGLGLSFGLLDAEALEIAAQPRQRTLVEEARQIVGRVGQQLAAAEADEEIEILAPDALGIGPRGGFAERRMCDAERAWIAAQSAPGAPATRHRGCAQAASRAARIPARARHRLRRRRCQRLAKRSGRKHSARDARCRLDREHALGGNAIPVRNRGLGDADAAREFADAADGAESLPGALDPASAYFLGATSHFRIGTVRNRNANATLPSIAQSYGRQFYVMLWADQNSSRLC